MNEALVRQTIVAELERARTAWAAYPLTMDYENTNEIVLSGQINPYVAVDIVFREGYQLDMGLRPMTRDGGQIILAVGAKEGGGTQALAAVRDYLVPYLQLRYDLTNGVRTSAATRLAPRKALGFYYLPLMVGFWCDSLSPLVP